MLAHHLEYTPKQNFTINETQYNTFPHPTNRCVTSSLMCYLFVISKIAIHFDTNISIELTGTLYNSLTFHMVYTKVTVTLLAPPTAPQLSPNKSSKSKSSRSRRKRLANKIDALAIQSILYPMDQDMNMDYNPMGPIAVRDYPEGPPMLLPLKDWVCLVATQERSRHRRQLLADDDTNSDKSQEDQPLHASISKPSSYHDVFLDAAHLSTVYPTGSAPNVSPNIPQNLKAKDLFVQAPPSSRSTPPTTSTQAVAI